MPEKITLNVKDGNLGPIISYVANIYGHPKDAIEQYVENSRDIYVEAGEPSGLIEIEIKARMGQNPKIVIRDYGKGMSVEKMKKLPQELTSSEKKQQVNQRGQKAIGMLSFFQFAGKCEIFSKTEEEKFLHKLTLGKDEENQLFKDADFEECWQKRNDKYGAEVVISNIDENVLRQITFNRIYEHLQIKFSDDIKDEKIRILLREGREGKYIDPEDISKGIPHPIDNIRTKYGLINFDIYLWPKHSLLKKVQIKIKGNLKILDDITLESDFDCFPWNSGQVFGAIKFEPLKPTTAKNRIVPDKKYYPVFIQKVKSIENELAEEVKKLQSEEEEKRRAKMDNLVSQIFKEVFRELRFEDTPFSTPAKTDLGDNDIAGEEDKNRKISGGAKPSKDEPTKKNPELPIINPDQTKPKTKGKYINTPSVYYKPFEYEQKRLHSYRDEIEKVIYINDIHTDYIRAKQRDETRLEYLLIIVAKETVIYENQGSSPIEIAEEIIKVMSIVNRKKLDFLKKV